MYQGGVLLNQESNRTIDVNQGMQVNNQRKLQNMRKSRYNPVSNVVNKSNDANANTYRGPVLKNGLHISQ